MKHLNYNQIYLTPKYSTLSSRSLAFTKQRLGNFVFNLPVIPANMSSVINWEVAKKLDENGFFYIMHRFGDTFDFVRRANKERFRVVSISTGVNKDTLKELQKIKKNKLRVDFITVDVAHGHHIKVKQRIHWIKENLLGAFIIAGNIATSDAYNDLIKWGADAVKCGIGGSNVCTTAHNTGFHIPMFSCVQNLHDEYYEKVHPETKVPNIIKFPKRVPIIADGGIRYYGDIVKALVAGADWVMAGSLFAACSDSPAEVVDGKKVYFGSASLKQKGENRHIEGITLPIEPSCSYLEKMQRIKEALQSSISYAGGENLSCLKDVDYVEVLDTNI